MLSCATSLFVAALGLMFEHSVRALCVCTRYTATIIASSYTLSVTLCATKCASNQFILVNVDIFSLDSQFPVASIGNGRGVSLFHFKWSLKLIFLSFPQWKIMEKRNQPQSELCVWYTMNALKQSTFNFARFSVLKRKLQ